MEAPLVKKCRDWMVGRHRQESARHAGKLIFEWSRNLYNSFCVLQLIIF